MAIKIGADSVSKLYVGANAITKVYLGSDLIADTGGGGGGYVAKAVHWSALDYLRQNVSGVADSPLMSAGVWVKIPSSAATGTGHFAEISNLSGRVANIPFDYRTNADRDIGVRLNGIAPDFPESQFFSDGNTVPLEQWCFLFSSTDTSQAAPAMIGNLLLNAISVLNPALTIQDGPAYNFLINGLNVSIPFDVPQYGSGINFAFDMADLQIWIGTYIDPTPTNMAKFISGGKPVDPAVAALAFGPQTFLFSGDHITFPVNQGTGGVFDLLTALISDVIAAPGPQSVTLTGAVSGQSVVSVFAAGSDASADFETTISVNNQIQQTGSTDWTGVSLVVSFAGTLTNATTSPSD